jgi:hypothetical protein
MLLLPRRINWLGKPHPSISDWRSTIYIYHLSPQRCSASLGSAGGERSMFAKNLPPVEQGSQDQLREIQLNRWSAATAQIRLGWRLTPERVCVGFGYSTKREHRGGRKGERRATVEIALIVYSQLHGNHAVPSLQSQQLTELVVYFYMGGSVNCDHPTQRPATFPSHRYSKVLMWLSTRGLVFCQRFCTSGGVEGCVPPSNTLGTSATAHACIAGTNLPTETRAKYPTSGKEH